MKKRHWRNLIIILFALFVATSWAIDYWVTSTTQQQLYSDLQAIPKNRVGLVLGTSKWESTGVVNAYYKSRIDAAVELYNAGKIDFILVSGDNRSTHYNEPQTMKNDLIARGIPANKIYMDNAGVHTLDSILRCRDIFGQDHFTIISQEFHNERALFIANHKHINAIAYNAKEITGPITLKVKLREKFSRIKMMFELLLNTQARFYYGPSVEIK